MSDYDGQSGQKPPRIVPLSADTRAWLEAAASKVIGKHARKMGPDLANRPAPLPTGGRLFAGSGHAMFGQRSWSEIAPFVDTLSPTLREATRLYLGEGLTYAQIAKRLGVSLGTVHSRLARGRKRMRQALAAVSGSAADTGTTTAPRRPPRPQARPDRNA